MRLWISSLALVLLATGSVSARNNGPEVGAKFDSGGLVDDDLRGALKRETSRGHKGVGYGPARTELMGRLSLIKKSDGDYAVRDVYCEKDFDAADFKVGDAPAPGHIPSPNVLNTEHTWPQSKFGRNEKDTQKCDLHHLFPTDNEMNGVRGNHPFGEVARMKRELKCPQSKAGPNAGGTFVFEPPESHRGNAARALFYFSVRYGLKIDETQENVLRKWNTQDPVAEAELVRNDEIEKIQGNRNPFIDDASLVDRIHNF